VTTKPAATQTLAQIEPTNTKYTTRSKKKQTKAKTDQVWIDSTESKNKNFDCDRSGQPNPKLKQRKVQAKPRWILPGNKSEANYWVQSHCRANRITCRNATQGDHATNLPRPLNMCGAVRVLDTKLKQESKLLIQSWWRTKQQKSTPFWIGNPIYPRPAVFASVGVFVRGRRVYV